MSNNEYRFPKEDIEREQECEFSSLTEEEEWENGDLSACSPTMSPSSPIASKDGRNFSFKDNLEKPPIFHPAVAKVKSTFELPVPTTPTSSMTPPEPFGQSIHPAVAKIKSTFELPVPSSPTAMTPPSTFGQSSKASNIESVEEGSQVISASTYLSSLKHHQEFLLREVSSLHSENDDMYDANQALVKCVQALQQRIRTLLMKSELLDEGEEAIKEILGNKNPFQNAKAEKFRPRRKSSTCKRVEKWSLRYFQLKGERTELGNEQTRLYKDIEQKLERLEELENGTATKEDDKQPKRTLSDGVLCNRRAKENLKDRINKEVKTSTHHYFMVKIRRRAQRVKRQSMKTKFDVLFEMNRTRTAFNKEMKNLQNFQTRRNMDYESFQRQLLKRFGVWNYFQDARTIQKEGVVFTRKRISRWSFKYDWVRAYMQVSFLHGTVSIYKDGRKRDLLERFSLQNAGLTEGKRMDHLSLKIENRKNEFMFKAETRRETREWMNFFLLLFRNYRENVFLKA